MEIIREVGRAPVTVDMIKATLATAPKYSPTVLSQTDALSERKPVRLPRWLLGGRVTCPEARGWAPYEDQRHQWVHARRFRGAQARLAVY